MIQCFQMKSATDSDSEVSFVGFHKAMLRSINVRALSRLNSKGGP